MQPLQLKTADDLNDLTKRVEEEAKREQKAEAEKEKIKSVQKDALDEFTNSIVTLVPSPNFTDATPVGTFLPINMADETTTYLTQLNRKFDFIDFIKEKLNYSSRIKVAQSFAAEQIDALVMAITQFEKENAFILGDMAGIGKGRVCAGVMRYAYQQGLIPIFVTHKPYLLNDIYRDVTDIFGFGVDANGEKIDIQPLIMHPDGIVYELNEFGETIKDPVTGEKKILYSAETSNRLNKFLKSEIERMSDPDSANYDGDLRLPDGYNAVLLPYSTIGQASVIRTNYLQSIIPNSILIFDESHNAASANAEAVILKRCTPLVEFARGVLFSSATYAKSPAVFNLYVIKTALRTAVPTLDSITSALKVGGENVSEYIASGLVKEGQMIRRERSFSACKKVTEYVGTKRTEVSGKVIRTDDPDDKEKEFFNQAIGYFKSLRDFSTKPEAKLAIKLAIERECAAKGYKLVNMKEYYDVKAMLGSNSRKLTDADKAAAKTAWINANKGDYILKYKEDSITPYKQTFRENLFLSIKAKFTADLVLDCLNKEVKYSNFDGRQFVAPMKPLIAMKSTGQAIFNELDLNLGDQLKNDFSEYLQAIYKKLFSGKFEVRKVDNDIFEDEASLAGSGLKPLDIKKKLGIITEKYSVILTDFFDTPTGKDQDGNDTPRQQIINIQNSLNAYNSQIPFSVIDYLRYRIESTPRSPIYFKPGTFDAKYGNASSPFYKFLEATGREVMLEKIDLSDPDSLYVFKKNDRIPIVSDVYEAFNSGDGDVMLINVVASTGGSAQSSSKFKDQRPRNMFIIQFELDVNTEVQKRGRINRTGQVNSPTYTYIITKIPVEQRLYLMFRKKLRKLDANTSANQAASVESAELTDLEGEAIEDIFNPYGFEVFMDSFINVPANNAYKTIYDNIKKSWKQKILSQKQQQAAAQVAAAQSGVGNAPAPKKTVAVAGGEQDEQNYESFNSFVKELELYPVDTIYDNSGKTNPENIVTPGQKPFFDEMQILYKNYVRDLKQKGEYQLELIAREYKAVLKQSTLIQENAGTSVFSSSLFMSDYFTLNDRATWSRDRVLQKIAEIAEGQDPQERHIKLVADFERESALEMAATRKVWEEQNSPIGKSMKKLSLGPNWIDEIIVVKKDKGKSEGVLLWADQAAMESGAGRLKTLSDLQVKIGPIQIGDIFITKRQTNAGAGPFTYFGQDPQTFSILYAENKIIDKSLKVTLADGQEVDGITFDYDPEMSVDEGERTRYGVILNSFVNRQNLGNKAYLSLLKFFTPNKPIIYNGNVGVCLGVILKDSKGRYKYAPALVDIMFAFLSGYTTLRFNLTGPVDALGTPSVLVKESQIGQLQEMRLLTQVHIDNYDAPNAKEYKDQVSMWKPNPWIRIVKRFYTGNILSGIVRANDEKIKGGPTWQLTKFTNLDGSYTTAIQLNADSKALEKIKEHPKDTPLSVSCGSTRFLQYLRDMPVSTSENSNKAIIEANKEYTLPIWNVPNDKLIVAPTYASRAIAIVKTQFENKGIYYPIINFVVCQNYMQKKDENGKDIIVDIKPIQNPNGSIRFPERWNYLYHDDNIDSMNIVDKNGNQLFLDDLMTKSREVIKYASYKVTDNTGKVETKLANYGCLIKKYSFNLLENDHLTMLQEFLIRLSNVFQVNFEFRSDAGSYLNTPVFGDVSEEILKSNKQEDKFEVAEYVYQFIKSPSDELLKQIPHLKERKPGGAYGQIVVALPLSPTQCKTFECIPFNIPKEQNIVYVKMALSVLNDVDKATFIKGLTEKAKENVVEVGTFVEKFLAERSVPTVYFFGYLDVVDIGSIFQSYVAKEDISKLVVSGSAENVTKSTEIPKDKVTFEDAERFLMFLNP